MTDTTDQLVDTMGRPIAPEVIIDGVRYAPSDAASAPWTLPRIGIGITTHNRPATLAKTLEHHRRHLPPGARLVIVDDASDVPMRADYRFEENVGIARAKNKCLELLMAADPAPDHIFLFDDDAYPLVDGWHLPYIESPEPHLMYQFNVFANGSPIGDAEEVPTDGEHYALTNARGPMLYLDTRILPVVGGMDPAFGLFGYEHGDWSNRIHHAGLTTWRYADVATRGLIHSMDEHLEVERSVKRPVREQSVAVNRELFERRIADRDASYVEYREPVNVVLTSLYTRVKDPQRPGRNGLDHHAADKLLDSLRGQSVVMVTDRADGLIGQGPVALIQDEPTMSVYFARHVAHLRYLRAHPEIAYVWCVDATDVVLQGDPWADMRPDTLFIGYEAAIVDTPWMRQHSGLIEGDFLARFGRSTLLNIGVIGGSRAVLIEYLQALVDIYLDAPKLAGELDMGAANVAAYTRFFGRLEYGPRIVTAFKRNEANDFSIWRHK